MPTLDSAVATVRGAVRAALRAHLVGPGENRLLVACSGGPDSMALAAAVSFVAPRLGLAAGLVTVDHQLQAGSAARAEKVAGWAQEQGFDPVVVCPVRVDGQSGGPEAAARQARYPALVRAAREHGASAVLLGHTEDDQAETVLLALLRGAGPRGLAGMPVLRQWDGVNLVRPLLGVGRPVTHAACAAQSLVTWDDPHNRDPAYARTRARGLLRRLATELGGGVVGNLARTAGLVAADNRALDAIVARHLANADRPGGQLDLAGLGELPDAVRTRILHRWARELGVPGAALSHRHVAALDALVTRWHGQGPVWLPGGIAVRRRDNRLVRAVAVAS